MKRLINFVKWLFNISVYSADKAQKDAAAKRAYKKALDKIAFSAMQELESVNFILGYNTSPHFAEIAQYLWDALGALGYAVELKQTDIDGLKRELFVS